MLREIRSDEGSLSPEEVRRRAEARLLSAVRRGIERHGIVDYTRLLNEQSARLRAEGDRLARLQREQAGVTPPVAGPETR